MLRAKFKLTDPDALETLETLAAGSPLHPSDDNEPIRDLKIKICSPLSHYIPPTIEIVQKCHAERLALDFYTKKTTLRIDPESFNELITQLPTLTDLHSFSIRFAQLNAAQATQIIAALPPSVTKLDLDYNAIKNDIPQDFYAFCRAIINSKITSLTFGTTTFTDEEAKILAEHLSMIERPFKLIFHVGPLITDLGFQHYMDAMDKNPLLSISLSGKLGYAKHDNTQGVPTLAQLSLDVIHTSSEVLLSMPLPTLIYDIRPKLKTWCQRFELQKKLQPLIRQAQEQEEKTENHCKR